MRVWRVVGGAGPWGSVIHHTPMDVVHAVFHNGTAFLPCPQPMTATAGGSPPQASPKLEV